MKTKNLLKLLEDIKNSKEICVREYALKFGVSQRTMQRYLKDIEEFFGVKRFLTRKGCYKFPFIEKMDEVLIDKKDVEDFEKFAHIVAALNSEFLKFLNIEKKIVKKIVNEDLIYLKDSPAEEIKNLKFFKDIKMAIKYSQVLEIDYANDKEYKFVFKPYKIVFSEGNWYLCGVSDDNINNGFKFLRINFIKDIKRKKETFKKDKDVESFIENFQSLFSAFKKEPFEVVVRVNNNIKRFFKVKKFLKSQRIIKEDSEGLIISYKVTSDEEILFLVKKWLPDISILSPLYLKEKLNFLLKSS